MSSQLLSTQEATAVSAWVRLLKGHTAMRRSLSGDLLASHGLTVNDYECLLLLARADEGQLRRVDLADGLALTPSGVTRMLDGLQEQGLVDKATCARDARVTYAVLTDAGREKLEQAADSHIASVRALLEERYTEEELETLAQLLARLPGAGGPEESCRPQ